MLRVNLSSDEMLFGVVIFFLFSFQYHSMFTDVFGRVFSKPKLDLREGYPGKGMFPSQSSLVEFKGWQKSFRGLSYYLAVNVSTLLATLLSVLFCFEAAQVVMRLQTNRTESMLDVMLGIMFPPLIILGMLFLFCLLALVFLGLLGGSVSISSSIIKVVAIVVCVGLFIFGLGNYIWNPRCVERRTKDAVIEYLKDLEKKANQGL